MPTGPLPRYRPSYARAFRVPVAIAVVFLAAGAVLGQVLGSNARHRAPASRCTSAILRARSARMSLGHGRSAELITLTPRHACEIAGYPTLVDIDGEPVVARTTGNRVGLSPTTITATPSAPLALLIAPTWLPHALRLPGATHVVPLGGTTSPPAAIARTPIFSATDAGGLIAFVRMHGGDL